MTMEIKEIAPIVEAMLFVAGEPVLTDDLARALEIAPFQLAEALDDLERRLDRAPSGLTLKRFGEHVQLSTRAEFAPYIEKLLQPVQKQSLSQAALETLAIVAYRQPVTKLEMEQIRGVKCDYSVQSLVKKGMIEDVGRKDVVGRPILYATTDKFLAHFGLKSLDELPRPETGEPGSDEMDIQEI